MMNPQSSIEIHRLETEIQRLESSYGKNHPVLMDVLQQYASALRTENRLLDASNVEARLKVLQRSLAADRSSVSPSQDEKKCPYCAETIKVAATLCRFCNSTMPPALHSSQPMPSRTHQTLKGSKPEASFYILLFLSACGILSSILVVVALHSGSTNSGSPSAYRHRSTDSWRDEGVPSGWVFYRSKTDNDYLLVNQNLGYRGEDTTLGYQGVGTDNPGDINSLAWTNAISKIYLDGQCERIMSSNVPVEWREALKATAGITATNSQKEVPTQSSVSDITAKVRSVSIPSQTTSPAPSYSVWGPEVFENSELFKKMEWSSLYQSSEGRVYIDGKQKRLLFIECAPSTRAVVCARCVALDSQVVADMVAFNLDSLYNHFIWQANDPSLASRYSAFRGTRNQDRYGGFEIGGCQSDFSWASSIPSSLTVQTAEGFKTVALTPTLVREQLSYPARNTNHTPSIPAGAKMGNIAPYRKDMLARINAHWEQASSGDNIVMMVEIGKLGNLLSCELIQGSGDEEVDRRAIAAIKETRFAPLPDWYKGESIPFKIEMASMSH